MATKPLRPASTVILLSKFSNSVGNHSQFRVLFVKRASKAAFFPTAHVFPGGVVETKADGDWNTLRTTLMTDALVPLREEFGDTIATRIGGLREVFEEVGLALIAASPTHCKHHPVPLIDEARKAVHDDPSKFQPFIEKLGVVPAVSRLLPWAHWITPVIETRRFDTFFYLAAVAGETLAVSDNIEVESITWLTPQEVLQKAAQKQLSLPPPTTYLCKELAQFKTIEEVLERGKSRDMRPVLPIITLDPEVKGQIIVSLPGDVLHTEDPAQFPSYFSHASSPTTTPSGLHRVVGMGKTSGPFTVHVLTTPAKL